MNLEEIKDISVDNQTTYKDISINLSFKDGHLMITLKRFNGLN